MKKDRSLSYVDKELIEQMVEELEKEKKEAEEKGKKSS